MKRFLTLIAALVALPVLAQTSQPIVVVGGALKTIPAGNALQIPQLGTGGAKCVQADAIGVLTTVAGPCATGGSGTVTSVAVSGGTTGLTTTGGPVTTTGTITLGGTLGTGNGGTGSTTPAGARTALGVAIGSDVQAYSAKLGAYAGGDTPSAFTLGIVDSADAAAWRTAIGAGTSSSNGTVTSVAASGGTTGLSFSGSPVTTNGTITLGGTLGVANGGTGASTLTGYVKGSGTSALTASSTVPGSDISGNISGNAANVTGTVAIANGGTGATTAAAARAALGAGTGDGTVTSVAALTLGTTGTDVSSSVANGSTTPAITLNIPTASASNRGALSSSDWSTFNGKQAALVSGTNIKTVGGLTLLGSGDAGTIGVAYGGTGSTTASGARTNLGLGTAATQNTGTGGANVPLLNGANTWGASQIVTGNLTATSGLVANGGTITISRQTGAGSEGGQVTYGYGNNVAGDWFTDVDTANDFRIFKVDTGGAITAAKFANSTGALTLAQPLSVANGGTGATDATTARTNLGLGTAATQNTGTSGANIPLLSNGNTWGNGQTFSRNGAAAAVDLILTSDAGQYARTQFRSGGSTRWVIGKGVDAESGSNAGSSFIITRYDDAGASLGTALAINRTNGVVSLGAALPITSGGTGSTTANGAMINLGATTVGYNFLTLPNPSAVTYPRIDASNTVTPRTAAQMVSDIGAVPTDASGNTQSVANSGTVDFANFSGKIIINDHTSGSIGEYLVGQGTVLPVGVIGTMSGTLAYVSGINGYRFTNTSGTTHTYVFVSIRTRPAA